jgi:hypothetical protein
MKKNQQTISFDIDRVEAQLLQLKVLKDEVLDSRDQHVKASLPSLSAAEQRLQLALAELREQHEQQHQQYRRLAGGSLLRRS